MGRFRDVELDDVEIVGPRLLLRDWRPDDADRVEEIMTDRSMYEFLALPDPYTLDVAREYVTAIGQEGRRDGTGLGNAVVERASGRVVGSAALRIAEDGEIGYWVAGDARGHGYAAEATGLLADWAFDRGLPRVRLMCDARNLPSIRTALRAGFRYEGLGRASVVAGRLGTPSERRGDLARFSRLPGDPAAPVPPTFPWLEPPGLGDGELTLRPMHAGDADALIAAEDELSVRWGFTGHAAPPAQLRERAARAGMEWLVGRIAVFVLVENTSGRVAGFVDLRRSGPPGVCGVGYTVVPEFRGRGYTARALRLVAPWAFEHADVVRLEIGAKHGNVASQRAALSAGFAHEITLPGRLRDADGSYSDEVQFALLAPGLRRSADAGPDAPI